MASVNIVDFTASKIIEHIPSCNKVWAYSNALSLQQCVMEKYYVTNQLGKTRANDYYCTIGLSGSWKSQVTNISLIPILNEVSPSLLLPSDGSKEGFVTYMVSNTLTSGIIDHDEISKFYRETQGKGYKSGDTEMLCKLWDGRSIHTATISRDSEVLKSPYIIMMASGTHVFLEMFDENFFRNGLGNRILWSFADPNCITLPEINADFFDKTDKTNRFGWHEKVSRHLKKCSRDVEIPMFLQNNALEKWSEYFRECMNIWHKQGKINPLNWEYSPYNRFPHHALKAAMAFALGDPNNLYFRHDDENPLISGEHMEKAINFVRLATEQYLEMIPWKQRSTTNKPKRADYSEMAVSIYATLGEHKNKLMFISDFLNLLDIEKDYDRKQIKKIFEERGWIRQYTKSELTPEQIEELGWTTDRSMSATKALMLL